ncbi:MAG: hypothetical protein PHD47_04080 [Acholeplasmataceae bacterium]|nr:hypothetical protein [Acholeplasmataceae bacterium]
MSLINTYTSLKWYYHILLFIGSLLSSLAIHELTHFFAFLIKGYKNEALILLFMIFYKNEQNKWRLKIDFKLLILGGGLVFTKLGIIDSDESLNRATKATAFSLIAAPLMTIISSVLLSLTALIFFYQNNILVPLSLYVLIFSIIYTFVSTKEGHQIFGDFVAYKKIKKDPDFAFQATLQYSDEISQYQFNIMQNHIDAYNNINFSAKFMTYYMYLLEKNIFEDTEVNLKIYKLTYPYINNNYSFKRLLKSTYGIEIIQSVILYASKLGFTERSIELLDQYIVYLEEKKINEKYINYISKQTHHLLGLSNESEYINNKKNITSYGLSFIMNHIPSFIKSELKRNEGFNAFNLRCKID